MAHEIQLTKGKVAVVDDVDAGLANVCWHAAKSGRTFYAVHSIDAGTKLLLHRAVASRAGFGDAADIDHVNGDGLDCRRSNLRPSSHAENGCNRRRHRNNSSGFLGVCYRPRDRIFVAAISIAGKRVHLGSFRSAEAAARARDEAARQHYGPFATFNFPATGERAA